jgi:ADP-ribose pyrophosphatase YjhB (NUDIX family)
VVSFSDDPVAWRRYLAEGNARQARKRVSADALFRDTAGRILLVDPVYKPNWDLPGGMAEANESPRAAAVREVREELGFAAELGELLLLEWMPPHGPWDDLLAFIFDGGELTEDQIAHLQVTDEELRAFEFCTEDQAAERLRPYVWQRLTHALEALRTGRPWYGETGGS